MLDTLPPELILHIISFLEWNDASNLLYLKNIRGAVSAVYPFHFKTTQLLEHFEQLSTEDQESDVLSSIASNLLHNLRVKVEECPQNEQQNSFKEYLEILENIVLQRILSLAAQSWPPGLEQRYGKLCLRIREIYMKSHDLRLLHDRKYRRRSTRSPKAPFLPRVYAAIWREHCEQSSELLVSYEDIEARKLVIPFLPLFGQQPLSRAFSLSLNCSSAVTQVSFDTLIRRRASRRRFARFYGTLFVISSMFLGSHLEGTFEEAVREVIVEGDVESLFEMIQAAGRSIDVEELCTMVINAGEQLREQLQNLAETPPAPTQTQTHISLDEPIPEWLLPERYQIKAEVYLRLKLISGLKAFGWVW